MMALYLALSSVRFTDYIQVTASPSDESLGYFHSSADADGVLPVPCCFQQLVERRLLRSTVCRIFLVPLFGAWGLATTPLCDLCD
jgi:hypothetical protein